MGVISTSWAATPGVGATTPASGTRGSSSGATAARGDDESLPTSAHCGGRLGGAGTSATSVRGSSDEEAADDVAGASGGGEGTTSVDETPISTPPCLTTPPSSREGGYPVESLGKVAHDDCAQGRSSDDAMTIGRNVEPATMR